MLLSSKSLLVSCEGPSQMTTSHGHQQGPRQTASTACHGTNSVRSCGRCCWSGAPGSGTWLVRASLLAPRPT